MRQLEEKPARRLAVIPFPVFMPGLDLALRELAMASPLTGDAAGMLLQRKGVTAGAFHPASVIAAARACGRRPSIELRTIDGQLMVLAVAAKADAGTVLRIAYRQAHASGASNVSRVVAAMKADGVEVDAGFVRDVLHKLSQVTFVGEDWFYHRPANPNRDCLRNAARKMLSVASPMELPGAA